jgi:2-oxoglutarate dehydrogenase E2 component (dihydrolipoamide succinyltransferase)
LYVVDRLLSFVLNNLHLVDSVSVSTPSFPESVKDGTIRFLKKVGDKVAADETIAEIETDKTNLNVNSPHSGVIEELLVADGDNVTSGASIAKLNTSGGGIKPTSATSGWFRNIRN